MKSEGDIEGARERYFSKPRRSLEFLLNQRYSWMNEYLKDKSVVVELGAGAGFSKLFLICDSLKLTDVVKHPWIDLCVDALNPPFENESLDIVICSHMIHHLAYPKRFFNTIRAKLKLGGAILIQDINTSFLMRILLRLMRHEGWSFDIDVFDENATANDSKDPWSANCAIPELLFRDSKVFEQNIPGFVIELNRLNECFLFPLSGGVIAKTSIPDFPDWSLRLIQKFDVRLISAAPGIFALGRSVVLRKTF